MRLIVGAALLLLAGCGGAQEEVFRISGDDAEMQAARAEAKRGLPGFLARVDKPGPGESDFLAKFDIAEGDAGENVWAGELRREGPGQLSGLLINQPRRGSAKAGERVRFAESAIVDWAYVHNGQVVGGYTNAVLTKRGSR